MTVALMSIASLLSIAVFFVTTMYNHIKRRRDLFINSAFVLFIYVAFHLGSTLWLSSLSFEEVLPVHYLYYAAGSGILALGLFIINREKLRMIMIITISLLALETLIGYAVHIDRNVVALNGAAMPNIEGATMWFLWDIRDFLSELTTFTVFLAVALPNIYQVSKDTDNTDAFEIMEDVEVHVEHLKPSKRKERASVFLEATVQNLFEPQNTLRDKLITSIGITLLNEAIKECCYEPERKKPVGAFGRFVYWLRS